MGGKLGQTHILKKCPWGLERYFIPLILYYFLVPRWLYMGFINHHLSNYGYKVANEHRLWDPYFCLMLAEFEFVKVPLDTHEGSALGGS